MIRNLVGSVLALAGATAAVWSPFRAWYDGRPGHDYRIEDLFGAAGITDVRAQVIGSVFLPMAFAAVIALVGVVLRSRVVVAVAGVVVLGFTILWMVRVGQAAGGLSVGSDGRGLGSGVAMALGGGVLLLVGAVVMSGRPEPHVTRVDQLHPPAHRHEGLERLEHPQPPGEAPEPSSDVPWDPGRDETPPSPEHRA
ncbi:hypothetical protein ACFYU9_34595 [Streptomyces sp. NPDC004327]|uniref:hypothetical protein n=1 Tax=unclassified Streptomyces TaxID=2593676 RepID=UPI0036C0304B